MAGLQPSFADDEAGFQAAIGETELLITWVRIVQQRLAGGALKQVAPKLRTIFCTSAGLDRLAPFDWLPEDVALLNNRGAHSVKAGEFGLMALLMLANHLPAFAQAQQRGEWAPKFGSVLAGRRLVVVGLGSLGGAVATRAQQFGMRVTGVRNTAKPHEACERVVTQDELDGVLPEAEFLVLACPLTPATRGLLDRRRLSLLPQGAKLVNIARGPVWDQEAVADALESGHLGGALTDVAVPEPLPPGHRLWSVPGLFITPHMSVDDPETYNDDSLDILFANLRAARGGEPMANRIDPVAGY